jgi:hypothetical protein
MNFKDQKLIIIIIIFVLIYLAIEFLKKFDVYSPPVLDNYITLKTDNNKHGVCGNTSSYNSAKRGTLKFLGIEIQTAFKVTDVEKMCNNDKRCKGFTYKFTKDNNDVILTGEYMLYEEAIENPIGEVANSVCYQSNQN